MKEKLFNFIKNYCVFIIALLAAAAAFIYIMPPFNADIINYDSAYQYFLTRHSFRDIAVLLPQDYSPPLYTVLLKLWTIVFGGTLASMRSFSVMIIWGMIFLAAFPVRRAFGNRTSLLCILFYTLSSLDFILVPEIRPTVLACFVVAAAAIYSYLSVFYEYRYAYVCMTVFSVLAMYTHNAAMLSVLAFYIVGVVLLFIQKNYKKMLYIIISGAICAVCYIPWLIVVFGQFANVKNNYWSNSDISLGNIIDWTYGINYSSSAGGIFKLVVPVLFCITAIAAVRKLRKYNTVDSIKAAFTPELKDKGVKAVYLLMLYVGAIAALVIFALLVYPIIAKRYFYMYAPILLLIISAYFGCRTDKWSQIPVLIVAFSVIANFGVTLNEIGRSLKSSDFMEMTEQIAESENVAFLHSHEWSLGIMMYYFPDAKHYVYDDTWCVLTSYDVFPSEVVNVGDIDNISEYESDFYVFGDNFADTEQMLDAYFTANDKFDVTYIGFYEEPYTYKKGWQLYNVSVKD